MAAGAGYIEFATGDILTASAANQYLASQVVMVFASASARTTAIASPQEGMVSYLKDTNAIEYYSGSAWTAVGGGGAAVVKQIVFGQTVTSGSNSSTTYADTTLSATITPTSTSSDIYILVAHTQCYVPSGKLINLRLLRDSTTLRTYENNLNNSAGSITGGVSFNHKDSPASTSALTYKTQFASTSSGGTVEVQVNGNYSSIILLEVGA